MKIEMRDLIMLLAKGNPGALQFLESLRTVEGGAEAMLIMQKHGICGADAYKLWNDCCGRNESTAVEILKMMERGQITEEEVKEHINQPYGTPFDMEELRKMEPQGGYLHRRHGVMMLGRVPEGTCEMCAVAHDPAMPHNLQSLTYQYKFYDQHGRWPTWKDAMEHCAPEVQQAWAQALKERGVNLE